VVELGQTLTVKIESVDSTQKRIALVPEDFTPKENVAKEESTPLPTSKEPVSMGTFGDLLKKSQLAKKR